MVLPYAFDRIEYARNLGYYMRKNMVKSVKACHRLFGTEKPMYDQLYMLKVLPY